MGWVIVKRIIRQCSPRRRPPKLASVSTTPLGTSWNERMAPCAHEAGHAVIAHALGARVAHVRIADGGAGSGDSLISTDDPRTSVHVRVAGYPAELRYCEMVGDCPADRHPMHSAHDDNERAWALAQKVCPGDLAAAAALLAQARETVGKMVEREWDR